jgi:hypothetical protein
LIQALQDDPECKTEKDRVQKFMDSTRLGRATYFSHKKELMNAGQLKPITRESFPEGLAPKGTPPPSQEEILMLADEEEKVEETGTESANNAEHEEQDTKGQAKAVKQIPFVAKKGGPKPGGKKKANKRKSA